MLSYVERKKLEKSFEYVSKGQNDKAAELINELSHLSFMGKEYCREISSGLLENDWSGVGRRFANSEFIDRNGYFLLIGPYSRRRDGFRDTRVSGVFGVVTLNIDIGAVRSTIESLFGRRGEPFAQVLGFRLFTSFGLVGGEAGEAFLVPTSWGFPEALEGPALNDLTEQTVRLRMAVNGVRKLFSERTQEVFLPPVLDPITSASTRNIEYQYHDAGHSTGLGIKKKMESGWFREPRNCGIEEWRSDGVMFYLARKTLGAQDAARLVTANIVLRLGVDVHRKGGIDRDPDVFCTALLVDDLLSKGCIAVDADGRVEIDAESAEDVCDIVSFMIDRATGYTSKEVEGSLDKVYADLMPSARSIDFINRTVRKNLAMEFMA